jgi:hypothetical protein
LNLSADEWPRKASELLFCLLGFISLRVRIRDSFERRLEA